MTKKNSNMLLSGIKKNKPVTLVLALALVGFGVYWVVGAHAGGVGEDDTHASLRTPQNVQIGAACGAVPGIGYGYIVSWDRPHDYKKVEYYTFYQNSNLMLAGNGTPVTFGVSGLMTPDRTSTCVTGTFANGDKIAVQSHGRSAQSVPAIMP